MAVESKVFPVVATAFRRYFVWAQIVIVFLFLELAIWAPTPHTRNRWAAISAITILVFVLINVLINVQIDSLSYQPSLERLGLGLPGMFGATVVLGVGLATVVLMVILV